MHGVHLHLTEVKISYLRSIGLYTWYTNISKSRKYWTINTYGNMRGLIQRAVRNCRKSILNNFACRAVYIGICNEEHDLCSLYKRDSI